MNTKSKIVLAVVAGAALGAAATQGLHAQAKLKAYSVSELDIIDVKAQEAYLPGARKAIADAHGRSMGTLNGKVFHIEGAPAPMKVAMTEWDSADAAKAFFQSKTWKDLAPEGEKTAKTVRRYIIEVEP